ncbi:unsaturated rhamnogalacturonan hydrolase [Penicillium cosmopolitanum]|uniref:Unsaturated rhamnogalacturonan hydrolase n=1 Tax=Penicillium cosmopolitanum TaxID=1131564 RepID=A0A9X0B928_9EURO|nr:unsaturated rhamnogalacturonan hydrolase [Penicillium cosmopolitanum]KAJ5392573.1 unsaturated rhamnogalacturonan hydrolase [Penicillium cosmopolitanum]
MFCLVSLQELLSTLFLSPTPSPPRNNGIRIHIETPLHGNPPCYRPINNLINIRDDTGEFLVHLKNGQTIQAKCWNGWEWTHGVGLYGIWKIYEMTGKELYLKIIEDWFAERFMEGGTSKNINTMAPFLTLAYVYERTRNQTYLPWLDAWAEWAMYDLPRTNYGGMQHITYVDENEQELWDDTLMMTVMPLAKIGKLLGRDDWCTMVIPEILELLELDVNDPVRCHLCETLEAQYSYLEASATAGFAYGILKAVRRRYIGAEYRDVGLRAVQSVLRDVDEQGELRNTSYGTPMGHDLQFYKDIPITSMPYGQAMAIMALAEYLRTYL